MTMKFIQVFNRYLAPGGEEKSVARIATHLELGGHQVTRFWRSSAEWQGPQAPPRWRQPFLMRDNPQVLHELQALHAREQPDAWIVHNVLPVVSLGIYGRARKLGVPILQWLHNYRPLSPSGTLMARDRALEPEDRWLVWKEILAGSWRGPLLTAWIALSYAQVRRRGDFASVGAWIAISEEMKRVFERAGWRTEALFTLRHSWEIRSEAPSRPDAGYFLFLGRMVESKGVSFLVDLWRQPSLSKVQLVMAGEGALMQRLKGRLPANVRWVGHVEGKDKHRLLADCRAVVIPSLWPEPLGLVCYEAYELGKPVLASRGGGLIEMVTDRQTGRLLPTGSASAWQQAVLELEENVVLAKQWGEQGRRWLEAQTAPSRWNERFNQLVERVFADRRRLASVIQPGTS